MRANSSFLYVFQYCGVPGIFPKISKALLHIIFVPSGPLSTFPFCPATDMLLSRRCLSKYCWQTNKYSLFFAYMWLWFKNLVLKKSVLLSFIFLSQLTPPVPSGYNSGNAITSWSTSLIQLVGTWPWPGRRISQDMLSTPPKLLSKKISHFSVSFKNYVMHFLPFFDHPPTHGNILDMISLMTHHARVCYSNAFADHPTTPIALRNLWTAPRSIFFVRTL